MPISKIAEYTLQPHQERVDSRLDSTPGLVAWHSLGSGKTLTALNAIATQLKNNPGKKALVIVPAPLVENIKKEIVKHDLPIPMDRVDIMSYDKAVNMAGDLARNSYALAVLDESHKLRETNTKRYSVLKGVLEKADKRLLLTGTASYNDVVNIAPIIGLAANNTKLLPTEKREFYNQYVAESTVSPGFIDRLKGKPAFKVQELKNVPKLVELIKPYVDYHNSLETNSEDFPTLTEQVHTTPMDDAQHSMYKYLVGQLPYMVRKKVEWGLPLNKAESQNLNAFSTGIRQVSDSITPYKKDGNIYSSPKIQEAVSNLHKQIILNPEHKAVVYSNYIDAGIKPYAAELDKRGIPYHIFTGNVSQRDKATIVNTFNNTSGTPQVLLLSSSGGEGIDLKGVRQVQILEPHFNKSKIDQVVGRAQRYKSHVHLPEEDRNVVVEHYHSSIPEGFIQRLLNKGNKSIDQYLYSNSADKDKLTQELIKHVRTA